MVTAVILKLQWELDKIPRELVDCGITCLSLFAEGDATDPCRIVACQPARRWPPPTVECYRSRDSPDDFVVSLKYLAGLVQMCR